MSESNHIINSILHRPMMQHNDCLLLEMQEMSIHREIVNFMPTDLERCPLCLLVEQMLSIATIILPLPRHVLLAKRSLLLVSELAMGRRLLDMIAFGHHLKVNIEAMSSNSISDIIVVALRTLQPGLTVELTLLEKSTEVVILPPTSLHISLVTISSDIIPMREDTQSRLGQLVGLSPRPLTDRLNHEKKPPTIVKLSWSTTTRTIHLKLKMDRSEAHQMTRLGTSSIKSQVLMKLLYKSGYLTSIHREIRRNLRRRRRP
jgi:hypothetical protein